MPYSLSTITNSGDQIGLLNSLPFTVGANLYVANGGPFGTHKSHVYKSTDKGATWIEMDPLNAPAATKVSSAVFDGSRFIWVSNTSGAGVFNTFYPFDTMTDTWGTSTQTAEANASGVQDSLFYRQSDHKILLVSQHLVNEGSFGSVGQCQCVLFDTVSLTSTAWIPCGYLTPDGTRTTTQGVFGDAVSGTESYMVFLIQFLSGVYSLSYQSIDGSGTLGSLTGIDTDTVTPFASITFWPACDGSNVLVAWTSSSDDVTTHFYESTLATLPVFTKKTVVFPPFGVSGGTAGTCLVVAGVFYFVGVFEDTSFNYYVAIYKDSGSGWDSGTVLIPAQATQFFNVGAEASSIDPSGFAIVIDATPPLSFLLFSSPPAPSKVVVSDIGTVVMAQPGNLCQFARPKGAYNLSPMPLLVGKEYTYPESFVRG